MYIFFNFICVLSAFAFLSSACYAPPPKGEEGSAAAATEAPQHIRAHARFTLLQKHLAADPAFTFTTPTLDLCSVYDRDKLFLLSSTNLGELAGWRHNHINCLDALVREAGLDKQMSYRDYVTIAHLWACILSRSPKSFYCSFTPEERALPTEARITTAFVRTLRTSFRVLRKATSSQEFYEAMEAEGVLPFSRNVDFLDCRDSEGVRIILVPQVSPNGAVPVSVIKEAFSFYLPGSSIPCSVHFVGLGMGLVDYDGVEGGSPLKAFSHDLMHVITVNFTHAHPQFLSAGTIVRRIAKFRCALAGVEFSSEAQKILTLAEFVLWHEGEALGLERLSKFGLKGRLAQEVEDIDRLLKNPQEFSKDSYTIANYNIRIKGARSLKLPITGETFEEQVQSYLALLRAGLELLLPHAHAFDEAVLKKHQVPAERGSFIPESQIYDFY